MNRTSAGIRTSALRVSARTSRIRGRARSWAARSGGESSDGWRSPRPARRSAGRQPHRSEVQTGARRGSCRARCRMAKPAARSQGGEARAGLPAMPAQSHALAAPPPLARSGSATRANRRRPPPARTGEPQRGRGRTAVLPRRSSSRLIQAGSSRSEPCTRIHRWASTRVWVGVTVPCDTGASRWARPRAR
jgi:hypothetical protein